MGVGALAMYGSQPNYRGYEATGIEQVDAFYGGLSSAASKAETKTKGDVLGITMIPYSDLMSYGMAAKYSESSTAEDPVIQVSCNYGGEKRSYDIHVNDVNPRNASQMEMFALCCYTDDMGITDGGSFGSYSKMKGLAQNAAYNGFFPDLSDPANAGGKFDWIAMLEKMSEVYLGNSLVYDQYLDATNLATEMQKWADTHSMDFEKSLSCKYAKESTEDDPVVEVSVKRHGETVTEKFHINDLNPQKATQQEIYAYLYHYDEVNGTQGSYETLMAHAQTAAKQGYWEKTASYEEFTEEKHNWGKMFTDVWTKESYLGLNSGGKAGSREYGIYDKMTKDSLKFFDFDKAKMVDMSEHASLKYNAPNVPKEISAALYNHLYGKQNGYLSEDAANVDLALSGMERLLRRIERQLDADGSRDSMEDAWDSAYKAIEHLLSELNDFYGEDLGSDDTVKENVRNLKKQYQSLLQYMDDRRKEGAVNGSSEESGDDNFVNLIREHIAEMYTKLQNGDVEQEFQIGSLSLTIKEWEKLIDEIDEIEEEIRKEIREEIEQRKAEEAGRSAAPAREAGKSIATSKETEKEVKDEGTYYATKSVENIDSEKSKETGKGTTGEIDESVFLTSEVTKSLFKEATEDKPEISYITCYTQEGIICKKFGSDNDFGEYLWKLDYKEAGDYEKVMSMIQSFPSDWNLRFASNEAFWKDYLEERIDKEDFIRHMNEYTDKGNPNYLIERDGNTYVNMDAIKYSKYLNNPENKMYTLEEFTDIMAKQIEENNLKCIDTNDSEAVARVKETVAKFRRAMLGANYEPKTKHSDYYSQNYTWKADNKEGHFQLYGKDGTLLGIFKYKDLVVKRDAATGMDMLISGYDGTMWYDAIPLNAELRKTLTHILGTDELPTENLSEYTIKTHSGTGLRYLVREGEEGRGGKILITSPADQAAYDRLVNEYLTKYPGLVDDAEAANFYASLEVRGLARRTPGGILTINCDGVSYNDASNYKKNWSVHWDRDDDRYEKLMEWYEAKRLGGLDMESFKAWKDILEETGGYERNWSKEELEQGYLNS